MTQTRATGPVGNVGHRLLIGDPETVAVSLVVSPQQTIMSLLREVSTGRSKGASAATLAAVRGALGKQPRMALQSFAAAPCSFLPDACVPIPPFADSTVEEQVARLRGMPGEVLTDELHEVFGDAVPDAWRTAAESPRRWLHSWAAASLETWSVTAHQWRGASRSIDREIRRVATAALRGSTDVLLGTLHPRLSFRNGELRLAAEDDGVLTLSGRRLALVPMIGAGDAILVSFDQPDLAYIAYPLPRAAAGAADPAEDPLDLTLGPVRAATLRMLSRPHTVGQLATALGIAPATTTYHCEHLHRAGLLDRTRHGRNVVVSRTPRGHELVELLSA